MQNAVEQCQETLLQAEAAVSRSRFSVSGLNRGTLQQRVDECNQKRQPIQTELAQIESDLRQIEEAVLKEARVVGATITRTYLRPTEFAAFDAVIIDEASMILLPSVFYAAGLATERVVITGDFRQLPPIIQTEQKAIHDILGPDIFEVSGITKAVNADRTPPRLVMLKQQYRMDYEICHHISHTFYRDKLVTATNRTEQRPPLPEPFAQRVTIIDTSSVWPFTTRNIFQSRFNLMHALAIRNLISHLRDSQCTEDSDGKPLVGLCTPYAAQAKLLNQVIDSSVPDLQINASTAHGFQGDERSSIVLDLVDSIGERNVGVFLQSENIDETGAKLLNVALSRAKEAIIIVANLTFLDARLPGKAILRELLYEFQRSGRIVDVRDVLALKPIIQDLRRFGPQPSIDPEALRTGLFAGKDFDRIARLDMQQAKKSIVIFSGFITPNRVASIGELLRCKIAEGVRVRCVTRPPQRNGSIPEELGRSALDALEGMGAIVDLRSDIHEKVVLVDGRVAWFGSLNPLSHTFRTSELMARIEDPGFAKYLSDLLSIRHRTSDDSEADATVAENPRCEKCGDRTILYRGHFGLFFGCASSACDWKRSVDSAAQTSSRTEKEPKVFSDEKASNQKCPKCGAPVKQRNGRFGIFYSCSRYPQCDGKLDNKPRNTKKTRRN